MSKLFPAAIHIHELGSSRDSLYFLCSQLCCMTFSIHWLKQRSVSLLHVRYCWKCSICQNSWILWWLPGQLAVGVRVFHWKGTQLWYLNIQDKKPVKTLGLFEYKDDCDAWFLDLATVFSLPFIHMAFFLTTARQTENHFCISSPSHTHRQSTFYVFEEWVMKACLTFACDEGATPDLYFPSWNKLMCLHCNSTQLQQGLFPCPTIQHLLLL
jgi:hypothetical protein